MDTKEVAQKLVEYARRFEYTRAMDELYSPDIVSVEAAGSPEMPAEQKGIEAVKRKAAWWEANFEVHSGTTEGPYPHHDKFAVRYVYEITPRIGPRAGQRQTLDEIAIYFVKDGKIVREEYYYET